MPLKVNLHDPKTGLRSPLDPMGALFTQERSGPPFNLDERITPFTEFLRNEAGSNAMNIIGTVAAPELFSLPAEPDADIYIVTLQFIIGAANMEFGDFGNGALLADPCTLTYKTETRTVVISDALAANSDFVLLAQGQPAFGTTTPPADFNAFKAQNPTGGVSSDDAYIPSIDFRKIFGLPWGVKLPVGRDTALTLAVRDDATAATIFTARAFGFIRFPDSGSIVGTT